MRSVKEAMSEVLSIPKEVALDLPLLTATGRGEVTVENYKNLVEFTETRIRLRTKDGGMTIEGERLKLRQITTENVLISGAIAGIRYDA
jgi:sporulation protein YqfC